HCHFEGLEWVTASGDGTIYSYTVVHQAFGPFAGAVPFVVGLVELAEGVRMLARIVGADGGMPDVVAIGDPVRVTFTQVTQVAPGDAGEEPLVLPYFQLAH